VPRRPEGPVLNKQTGYWFVDTRVGFPPNRRRIRFSLHTQDRARAIILFEREYKRLWSEYYGARPNRQSGELPDFEKAAEEYVRYERDVRRVKGWGTIQSRLARAAEIFEPGRRLGSIGDKDFAALDAALRKDGLSHGTVNHYMKLLKSFFTWAIDQGYHPGPNPARAVRPYVIDQRRRAYSAEEVERILAAASAIEAEARPQDGIMRHAERIVRLLLLTGMRAGELLNLKWSAIRGDRIVLERTETKQRREKTGISDFILHGLRHTASTIMVSEALGKGVGLADIMKIPRPFPGPDDAPIPARRPRAHEKGDAGAREEGRGTPLLILTKS
jgi:integrase